MSRSLLTAKELPNRLTFDLIRDEIPNNSIDLAYLIQPGIGYVHITDFQETTGRELSRRLSTTLAIFTGWCSTCAIIPAAC